MQDTPSAVTDWRIYAPCRECPGGLGQPCVIKVDRIHVGRSVPHAGRPLR